mgnify:CR=1 FL=1
MVHFQGLSNCFDEEAKLGPLKVDRVLSVQKRFDTQLAQLEKIGVDMTKAELAEMELAKLLHQTSEMTSEQARKDYDQFV